MQAKTERAHFSAEQGRVLLRHGAGVGGQCDDGILLNERLEDQRPDRARLAPDLVGGLMQGRGGGRRVAGQGLVTGERTQQGVEIFPLAAQPPGDFGFLPGGQVDQESTRFAQDPVAQRRGFGPLVGFIPETAPVEPFIVLRGGNLLGGLQIRRRRFADELLLRRPPLGLHLAQVGVVLRHLGPPDGLQVLFAFLPAKIGRAGAVGLGGRADAQVFQMIQVG